MLEKSKKSRSWLWVIGGCVVVTAALAWFKVAQIQKAIAFGKSFGEPIEAVELAVVDQTYWQQRVTVTAEVKATQVIELSNEVGGRIVEIGFQPGQQVSKGQLLLRLDTSEEQAQLAGAKADAQLAALALERNQKLAKSGVASEEARDQSLAKRNAAVATEDRLKAIIEKKTLRAPFDAKAGIFQLEPGQFLQANTVITRLVGNSNKLWLDFNLPQQQATLTIGDIINATISQFEGQLFPATIIARDSWVNPRSGNLLYRAVIDNAEGKLYPGTVVTVDVPVGAPEQVNRIPMSSVRFDAFGPNVYVLVPAEPEAAAKERAEKRRVVLGPEEGQYVVVRSGLQADERIAGNGAFKLRDGVLVKAVEEMPAATDEMQADVKVSGSAVGE